MSGEKDIQITKLQNIIGDLIYDKVPPPYSYNEARHSPFHTDTVLNQHLQSVGLSQRSRQQHASSSNNPESAHEPKGSLADLVTMGFQQQQENTLYGGNLNPPALSLCSYQIWDGECHISNILQNKGHEPNDYQENII